MSGRAEQSTKKKKKKNAESSVAKKKTRLGLKDLTDTPKTRADAKLKLGKQADGWIALNTGNDWLFKDPNGKSARGINNARKLLDASLKGSVVKGGFEGLEDNPDTRRFALEVIAEDASDWFGYRALNNGKAYFKGPNGLKAKSIDEAKALFKESKADEAKLKSSSSVDMLDSLHSEIVDIENSIKDAHHSLSEIDNDASSSAYKRLIDLRQREKDKLASKMGVVMKVLSSEVKSNEQALEIITTLDGAYKQLLSYDQNKLLGPKQEYESEITYKIRSDRVGGLGFNKIGGMSKTYHSSLRNDIRLMQLRLQTHLPKHIQETTTIRHLVQEVSNAEEELAKGIATKDDMIKSRYEKEKKSHDERKTSYEEASAAYYAAKEDKHHDKENVQKLKKEMINTYYNSTAGKDELRRNNGIRYQPKKLCLDDATDMLNLMDRFTFTS